MTCWISTVNKRSEKQQLYVIFLSFKSLLLLLKKKFPCKIIGEMAFECVYVIEHTAGSVVESCLIAQGGQIVVAFCCCLVPPSWLTLLRPHGWWSARLLVHETFQARTLACVTLVRGQLITYIFSTLYLSVFHFFKLKYSQFIIPYQFQMCSTMVQ